MTFLSIEPFVPSGKDYEKSKQLFHDLGFTTAWDAGDYLGFEANGCKFILQKLNDRAFAENFMLSVRVSDVQAFWHACMAKGLPEKYGIQVTEPTMQAYGMEVNLIDLAGVCWHFVE